MERLERIDKKKIVEKFFGKWTWNSLSCEIGSSSSNHIWHEWMPVITTLIRASKGTTPHDSLGTPSGSGILIKLCYCLCMRISHILAQFSADAPRFTWQSLKAPSVYTQRYWLV